MSLSDHPHIEMLAPSSLQQRKHNPRTHNDRQLAKIAASITKFGFVVPVIVDDGLEIVAGHARVTAALSLGLEVVPVIRVDFMTQADKRAFALAENRLAELGSWDKEILAEELRWLDDQHFNLDLTGFDLSDIDFELEEEPDNAELVELSAADAKAVSRVGDLWTIGAHKLLCGDATLPESYERLLGPDRAAMVFADPPYNVKIAGNVGGLGRFKPREFLQASGEMSKPEFTAFLRCVFRNLVRFSASGSIHYQCMDWRHMAEMLDASDGVYSELKNLVVWNKGVGAMGTFYRSAHELIFAFKSGKGKHINTFGLGEGGRYRTNVWSYPGANTFRKGRKQDLEAHPTVKSLAMVMDAILDCSNRGDLILDPFSGSGTTLIAAHKTRRVGAAIELDPIYVDTGLCRLIAACGQPAVHEDGRTFDAVAEDRRAEADAS